MKILHSIMKSFSSMDNMRGHRFLFLFEPILFDLIKQRPVAYLFESIEGKDSD